MLILFPEPLAGCNTLFVGGISQNTTEEEIKEFFTAEGLNPTSIRCPADKMTGEFKGYESHQSSTTSNPSFLPPSLHPPTKSNPTRNSYSYSSTPELHSLSSPPKRRPRRVTESAPRDSVAELSRLTTAHPAPTPTVPRAAAVEVSAEAVAETVVDAVDVADSVVAAAVAVSAEAVADAVDSETVADAVDVADAVAVTVVDVADAVDSAAAAPPSSKYPSPPTPYSNK